MHTLLDLRGPIPSFIHVSDGKMGDALALDLITPEAGAIYVMDRGYVDFRRLYVLHAAGAFFVTRAKRNMKYHRLYSHPIINRPASWQSKPSRSTDFTQGKLIPGICGEFVFVIRKVARGSCF